MSDITPTRSAVIALREERRAMQEGYVFLDEKCLLLAGTMVRELRAFETAEAGLRALLADARAALAGAIARHGLQELQCYPSPVTADIAIETSTHSLLGVALIDAVTRSELAARPAPVYESPEADACRDTFGALTARLATMAAISGNLERLYREYRRSVRRVRALQDVLLPEIDRDLCEIEAQLEDLEQDEALQRARGAIAYL